MKNIGEIAALFFKLGVIGFGGPAAHIAMMEEEVVQKRKWMRRQEFLDAMGATNLIPGPNSTEMTMVCGLKRGGWLGLFVAGACFIFPAVVLTGLLAWFYVEYHRIPAIAPLFYGIKPAVLAVIAGAVFKLGKKALKNWQLGVIGATVAGAALLGVGEIKAILCGGFLGLIWLSLIEEGPKKPTKNMFWVFVLPKKMWLNLGVISSFFIQINTLSISKIFLVFLKIGAILFGSGYVLVAYLEGELINNLGWMSQQTLLDAIAMGQFTPGPVLSTATFVGYILAGFKGAVAATLGIFLPSFLFVALLHPLLDKLQGSIYFRYFLDAVNISAMGIMLAVCLQLGQSILVEWQSIVIALLGFLAVFYFKLSSVYVVLGGAILGYFLLVLT